MGEAAIEVRGLRKSYGDVTALVGVDLNVGHGEVFSLLGPNGAGKTTICEILEGYRKPDAGRVSVLGFDPMTGGTGFRSRIGIVLQESGVEREFTVREVVGLYRGYYPHPRGADEVIDLVGLGEKRGQRVKTLSGGQKRRLDLALGIVGDPELIFLDEPTTGFDPSARRRAWDLIERLKGLGKTILLTTHYMDEAQALADRVAVISAGAIVAEGPPETLGGRDVAEAVVRFRLPTGTALSDLPDGLGATARTEAGLVELRLQDPTAALHRLTGWAIEAGHGLEALTVSRPTLEDVYLQLTGAGTGETDGG